MLKSVSDPSYDAQPERAIVFHVEALDVNCPQHIRPRYAEDELPQVVEKLERRIRELEDEIAYLDSNRNERARNDAG